MKNAKDRMKESSMATGGKTPSVSDLHKIFKKVNQDTIESKSGESVIPFSDSEYYSEQIQNIFDLRKKEADKLAKELSKIKDDGIPEGYQMAEGGRVNKNTFKSGDSVKYPFSKGSGGFEYVEGKVKSVLRGNYPIVKLTNGHRFVWDGKGFSAEDFCMAGGEQSYLLPSSGSMATGGEIKNQYAGMSPDTVWDNWTQEQRSHFLEDHTSVGELNRRLDTEKWESLPDSIKLKVKEHVHEGQYKDGGIIPDALNQKFTLKELFTKKI